MNGEYGLQMYSVRDITGEDLIGALGKVKALGYKYVEFAGFFGHAAEEVKKKLDELDLTVSGTHTGWNELTPDVIDATIEYHHTIGNQNIIIPGADLSDQQKLDAFIEVVNTAQPKLAAEGIALHYHNHSHEFKLNEDGSYIYGQLVERTQMFLEIDTYWAYVGHQDPVEMLDHFGKRVKVIHIKDGDKDGHGTPLGLGTAPVPAVFAKANELGIPMVVESETLTPDGITEAEICIQYLAGLEK